MTALPFPALCLTSSSSITLISSGSTLHALSSGSSSTASSPAPDSPKAHTTSLIRHVAISQDSQYAAAVTEDKFLRVYSLSGLSTGSLELLHTRSITKKASHLTFTPTNDLLISDKTGDTYLYSLHPAAAPSASSSSVTNNTTAERPPIFTLVNDPSQNPDATYLLGHVSVLTAHVLTPDHQHLITADRDEHIRVSRFPQSFVIERYLHGSSGFVSALHIPPTRPSLLLSAGGENALRIWDWEAGSMVGKVDIWSAVLPHRKVRSGMRKLRNPKKRVKLDPQPAEAGEGTAQGVEETFYSAPEGYMLPSGQGVLVKKIDSIKVGEETVMLFFSEGASALHSFVLPSDPSASQPTIHTLPLPSPILDFSPLPRQPNQLLISLDTAWGFVKANETPGLRPPFASLDNEKVKTASQSLAVASISADGSLSLSDSSAGLQPILSALHSSLTTSHLLVPPQTLASLSLYPDLFLYPRWPGFEEDDDEPAAQTDMPPPASTGPPPSRPPPKSTVARSVAGSVYGVKRDYSKEELEGMNVMQLGRLKSQGVPVGELLLKIKKEKLAKKRARALADVDAPMEVEEEQPGSGEAKGDAVNA